MAYTYGKELEEYHLARVAARWIDKIWANQADLRTVDSTEGAFICGKNKGDYAGIAIPYYDPFRKDIVHFRVRRDTPDMIMKKGVMVEDRKYDQAPQSRNRVYFPPIVFPADIEDATIPLIITEGEFKTLALRRLAEVNRKDKLPFLPIGIGGVYAWRGVIGKTYNQHGTRVDVKGEIPDLDRIDFNGRQVVLAFDADAKTNAKVAGALRSFSSALGERGATVAILNWDISKGKGIDDWLSNSGPEEVLAALSTLEFSDVTGWRSTLHTTTSGKIKSNLANAATALRSADEFKGVLGWNTLTNSIYVHRPFLWRTPADGHEWRDEDSSRLTIWMQDSAIDVNQQIAADAVRVVSQEHKFHPIREYLNAQVWDGIARIDSWLTDYMGAEPTDINSKFGSFMLISAVARVMQPGCKVDTMLIIEGEQGIGKSTAWRIMGGEWYTDNLPDISTKDAQQFLSGKWIIEMSELDALSKHDADKVKQWATKQDERFRAPYGREFENHPRQCIFVGSVNKEVYLTDPTGARRFQSVKVQQVDTTSLARDRDMLWAEARHQYENGAVWHFTDQALIQQAAANQRERFITHPWQEAIASWFPVFCYSPKYVGYLTVQTVLEECIQKPLKDQTMRDILAVSDAMKALGFKKVRRKHGTVRGYIPLDQEEDD